MDQLLLWVCFLAVLAGIGLSLRVLLVELQYQLHVRAGLRSMAAAGDPLLGPRRLTVSSRAGQPLLPVQRTGRGLAHLLPAPVPQASSA